MTEGSHFTILHIYFFSPLVMQLSTLHFKKIVNDGSYLAPVSKPPFKDMYHFRGIWEMISQVQRSSFLTACGDHL